MEVVLHRTVQDENVKAVVEGAKFKVINLPPNEEYYTYSSGRQIGLYIKSAIHN